MNPSETPALPDPPLPADVQTPAQQPGTPETVVYPARFHALDLDELRRATKTRTGWLWQGYLAAGNVTLLTSQWKSGKTTLLAVLLARLKTGGVLAGLPLSPGKAVVVSEESPAHWVGRGDKLDLSEHFWLC